MLNNPDSSSLPNITPHYQPTSVSFEVSKVERSSVALPTISHQDSLKSLLKVSQADSIEACSQGKLVKAVPHHPFIATVHVAFANHYPLILSPDTVWLCIAQGLALHVNAHAEELRHHFVQHQGKAKIEVRRDDFIKGSNHNNWPAVFDKFSLEIKKYIGDKHNLIICNFSTTGALERTVSEIVLMETVKKYFEYTLSTLCGIPEITLQGTVEDWLTIRERVTQLSQFNLQWWVDGLIPIIDEFIAAVCGQVNQRFWQSFYKLQSMSGGDRINGWINVLFPYLLHPQTQEYTIQNPLCSNSFEQKRGVAVDSFPLGLSRVPFQWEYHDLTFPMDFIGGFVGISQDSTMAVRPELGWAVLDKVA